MTEAEKVAIVRAADALIARVPGDHVGPSAQAERNIAIAQANAMLAPITRVS